MAHDGAMETMNVIQIEAAAYARHLQASDALRVDLEGPGGERWSAIGGGESVGEALAFALASSPADTAWRVVGWSPIYGD
jgi:hypothetical protein